MDLRKGDVILPKTRLQREDWLQGLFHAAVVWQDEFDGLGDFLGVILTTSTKYSNNIRMKEEHFCKNYKFGFKNSHFINQPFLKFGTWGPFEKVGELTESGRSFIEGHLTIREPKLFQEWLYEDKR